MNEVNVVMSERKFRGITALTMVIVTVSIFLLVAGNIGFNFVPSGSMEPTIMPGSMTISEHISAEDLQYGDVVLFFPEIDPTFSVPNFLVSLKLTYIDKLHVLSKRVVGLPGDVIEVHDGYLWRNGRKQIEEYVADSTDGEFGPYTVPDESIFCMGDNRNYSMDSRKYGAFPYNGFFGRIRFVLPPLFS